MEKIAASFFASREVKMAYNQASIDTGLMKREIMKAALEEWLIAHGYLDPYKRTAI